MFQKLQQEKENQQQMMKVLHRILQGWQISVTIYNLQSTKAAACSEKALDKSLVPAAASCNKTVAASSATAPPTCTRKGAALSATTILTLEKKTTKLKIFNKTGAIPP